MLCNRRYIGEFAFRDKIVISCNYKDGTKTVNFSEMESALSMRASASGSDLDCPGAPHFDLKSKDLWSIFIVRPASARSKG